MKVKDLIMNLLDYNLDAEMGVIANNQLQEFTITYGGCDGTSKKNCEDVNLYVDNLNSNENSN